MIRIMIKYGMRDSNNDARITIIIIDKLISNTFIKFKIKKTAKQAINSSA